MATTDETRDKLRASMRKSKTGAGSRPAAASRTATRKKAAASRAPARQAKPASSNKAAALAAATMPAVTQQASDDPYQSSGRIWPD